MSAIEGFAGEVITPSTDGYDDARAVWNGLVDRRPRLIARPRDAHEIATAIRAARDRGLELAVRGGGHNVAGTAVCDDGMVIDLSAMRDVQIDVPARRARVGGGALWSDVDGATQPHGLAVTGGIVSHTGVAGLTLGGGIGWLMRKHGLTIDNLVSAELVAADGTVISTSETQQPELFWALRGGGGNFGVVSSFEFELHPVGPEVLAGPIFWSVDELSEVLDAYRSLAAEAPRELGTVVKFGTIPPLPVVSEELHWRPAVAVSACWSGDVAAGEAALKPLREIGSPVLDLCSPKPYTALQSALDSTVLHGWHYYWKSTDLPSLNDDLIELVASQAFEAASPRSYAVMFHLGGAIRDVADDATAFSGRGAAHNININAVWQAREEEYQERDVDWVRHFWANLEPHRQGVYVNFLDADDGQTRVREAYGQANYDRLARIKAEYDPDNLFRHNQNIEPAR